MDYSELIKVSGDLIKNETLYQISYIGDTAFSKLHKAYHEFAVTYNLYAQQILSTPMLSKKPVNPVIAAAIGNGIAGIAGGVMMGVNAYNSNVRYNNDVAEFSRNLSRIDSSADKLAFIVQEIVNILQHSPNLYFRDADKEEYYSYICDLLDDKKRKWNINEIKTLRERIEALIPYKDLDEKLGDCNKIYDKVSEGQNFNYKYQCDCAKILIKKGNLRSLKFAKEHYLIDMEGYEEAERLNKECDALIQKKEKEIRRNTLIILAIAVIIAVVYFVFFYNV